jgi:hypothetical protein
MPTLEVRVPLSQEELLRAAEQLDDAEIDEFTRSVAALRARRHTPALTRRESELLTEVNSGLPAAALTRYGALLKRRDDESMTVEEYDELLRLSDEVEEKNARRWSAVSDLAQLRGVSLPELAEDLGILLSSDGE